MRTLGRTYLARLNSPKIVAVGLTLLMAAETVRIAEALLGSAHSQAPAPGQAPNGMSSAEPAARSRANSQVDIDRVVSAHLFGVPPSEAPTDPADLPRSAANLLLTATLATTEPTHGMAIISDGGPSKVYAVGERIGGASLHAVYPDRVILDRGGSLETLELPRPLTAAGGNARGPAPARIAAAQASVAAAQAPPQPAAQVPIVDRVAESSVETDSAGKLLGIRVTPGDDSATFIHSGLKGGDVVVAINGTQLDTPGHSQEMWNQVTTGTTLTVERRGKLQDVTVSFAP